MNINAKLKDYIVKIGVKQNYIAQKTGLHPDVVSRILRGTRKIRADEFLRICAALSLDPNIFRV